jgi:hypothetical protein
MLAELLQWLVTPISGASDHAIAMPLAWHGRFMVLAMGLLTPPLIIVARFFKIMPRQNWPRQLDNPFWFIAHRRWGHIVGAIVAIAMAFVLAERGLQWPLQNVHTAAGWLLVFLVLVQLIGSWLRGSHGGPVDPFTRKPRPRELWPGDHFSMTRRRIIFEFVHKAGGYLLLALTVPALCTGLIAADAPRWMPLALGVWWLVMAGVFASLQRAGRCVDTYQAIWGLDPDLPGNRRRPIGFGIVRHPPMSASSRERASEK